MHFIVKVAPLPALLASVSFGQSDINNRLGSTGETVSANANSVEQSSAGEVVASKFFPVWQHQSFAGYPKQIPRRTARQPKPRPRMEGSATGYIDNAIVGSQIRFRFDAGFNIQEPDRAEFFYAKCGCYRNLQKADPPNYDPNAPGPGPGIAKDLNFQELHLNVEYAPIQRLSFFADVPERSIEYTSVVSGSLKTASGLGDFKAGFKFALVASPERYITFQMGAFMPTGHPSLGLSTNHFSVEPMLLYHQRLSDRVTIAGQFGDWHPIDGSAGVPTNSANGFAGDVLTYGLGASYDFLAGSENHITPVLEFVGWSVLGGFFTTGLAPPAETASASGTNIVNGKLGVRFSFHTHNSIYVGFGQAITGARWYKEILRLEYRYAF
jgi:hypothetical protein